MKLPYFPDVIHNTVVTHDEDRHLILSTILRKQGEDGRWYRTYRTLNAADNNHLTIVAVKEWYRENYFVSVLSIPIEGKGWELDPDQRSENDRLHAEYFSDFKLNTITP